MIRNSVVRALSAERQFHVAKFSGFTVGSFQNPIVDQLWAQRVKLKRVDSSADSNAAASINARPPAYSKLAIKYPFKSQFDQSGNHSVNFKESYQNPWNSIRIGKVLEDLDALAGNIAYMHVVRGGDQNKKVIE